MKEDLKKYKDILKDMPENLNDLEKIRWIYIQLGKKYSYNDKYITTQSQEEKEKILKQHPEEIFSDRVVCTSLSKMYENLLKEVGIQAETIFENGHAYNEFELNGERYFADLTHDLSNIKVGFSTQNFLLKRKDNLYQIDEMQKFNDKIKKIDDKIGYTYNGIYTNEIVKRLKEEMQILEDESNEEGIKLRKELGINNLDEKDLLKYEIDFIANHMGHEELGCIEKAEYFEELIKKSINARKYMELFNEPKQISCVNKDKSLRKLFVITDESDNSKIIYNIEDKKRVSKISQDRLIELFEGGMKTLSRNHEEEKMQILFSNNTLTFNEIARGTVKEFSQNPNKAMKAFETLEHGVQEKEEIK